MTVLKFWDYDAQATITCDACGWSGTARQHEEVIRELVEVTCGECNNILLVVPFPTFDETRAAAAAGNPRALENMAAMEVQEAEHKRRLAVPRLTSPAQLPELPNEPIHVVWDIIDADGDAWHVLIVGEAEVWRELAHYEFHERYREVFAIVHERYGDRFASMHPTKGANWWLVGDSMGASGIPAALNATLGAAAGSKDS